MQISLYSLLKPLLFQLDPEKAHDWTLKSLAYIPKIFFPEPPLRPLKKMGLDFRHPLGLAAGLDKNGDYLDALSKLGFSFIELGTVTPKAQAGNPEPRLFRLPKAQALINRMGFNNNGVDALIANVKKAKYRGILGINIGKNKDTPLEKAAEDYVHCLEKVYPLASYITVNISSPNTPDLRKLQQAAFFGDLLQSLAEARKKLSQDYQKTVPILIKVSPDESEETLKALVASVLKADFQGLLATNTTASREGVSQMKFGNEAGGLSGKPLRTAATKTLALLRQEAGDALVLVGVGGIDSAEAALEKIEAGADLLQIYTGLIYQGPALIAEIVRGINPHSNHAP